MFSIKHTDKDHISHRLKEIIAEIPFGHIATIEEITEALELPTDKEAEITWALREINDNTVPTWRVVYDDGRLLTTSATGDWDNQKELLQKEGVTFIEEDKVQVHSHIWSACEYVRSAS